MIGATDWEMDCTLADQPRDLALPVYPLGPGEIGDTRGKPAGISRMGVSRTAYKLKLFMGRPVIMTRDPVAGTPSRDQSGVRPLLVFTVRFHGSPSHGGDRPRNHTTPCPKCRGLPKRPGCTGFSRVGLVVPSRPARDRDLRVSFLGDPEPDSRARPHPWESRGKARATAESVTRTLIK